MTDRWMWAVLLSIGWPLAAAAQGNGIQIRPDGTPSDPPPDSHSYVIPALEIVGFDFLLNRFNHRFSGVTDYDVSARSIRDNLHGPWITDDDPFKVNQFAHPYQGSIYHTAARSAGLGYWTASAYTFAGSVFWEIAGEQTPPSKNDQIASGIAGSFFGEPLFRMANLVLTSGNSMTPFWREVSAAAISPSVGFNRQAFGDRFRNSFESHDPIYYSSLRIGASSAVHDDPGTSTGVKRKAGEIEFRMDYGLPGKAGYTYDRPFDYFSFQALASTPNGVELLSSRGLLFGTDYAAGNAVRGLWGLYGNYDYMAPQIFNLSTTGLSLGSTAQAWLSDSVALQGTGLIGAGYSAASTARGTANDRDYHYGVAPNIAFALRLIAGTRAAIDVSAHKYFLGTIANRNAGRDDVTRVDSAFTWRLAGRQSVGVKYSWSGRNASYPAIGDRSQALGTVGIYYTLLGVDGFGVADWRETP
jgi:Domain of unknown function (DUF3943)